MVSVKAVPAVGVGVDKVKLWAPAGLTVKVPEMPEVAPADATVKELYREQYDSAKGKFTLTAPFVERFFQLAREGGYVGLINSSYFATKKFGADLVEKVCRSTVVHSGGWNGGFSI